MSRPGTATPSTPQDGGGPGRGRRRHPAVRAVVPFALAMAVAGTPVCAGEGEWTLQLEALQMSVLGHDQHVLTVHEIAGDPTSVDRATAVNLETDDQLAYRLEARHGRGKWRFGVDFFYLITKQSVPDQTAAASGSIDRVVFEVADREVASSGPGEVLFYGVLEDTELAAWTVDLYALRALTEAPEGGLYLQLGLRNADFDNDYRAVVGLQGVGGRRLDASSNYGRMTGPLVGLVGEIERGRHRFEGALGQSLVIGEAELSNRYREFTGPLDAAFPVEVELPTTFAEGSFRALQDAAIPITELRLGWTYRIGRHLSLGVASDTAVWWDVPVPPGVVPAPGGDEALHEATLVFFGLGGHVGFTF